jgi:hypothetical protein
VNQAAVVLESSPLKSHDSPNSTAGLFNNQFHSGLRRNETSGLVVVPPVMTELEQHMRSELRPPLAALK